jgi:hypothetical protein
LELTPEQRQHVRLLLEEPHDKIQALLDKNPKASRQELAPQIHAISDETHRRIHALLTDHQTELEEVMQQSEHNGQVNRRSSACGIVAGSIFLRMALRTPTAIAAAGPDLVLLVP